MNVPGQKHTKSLPLAAFLHTLVYKKPAIGGLNGIPWDEKRRRPKFPDDAEFLEGVPVRIDRVCDTHHSSIPPG